MNNNQTQLPPHDHDAERSVLGCMLRDNRVIQIVAEIVEAEDFHIYGHQLAFRCITRIAKTGLVDVVILADELREHIADVGGYPGLAALLTAAPTAMWAEPHAKIVKAKAQARRCLHLKNIIDRDAHGPPEAIAEMIDTLARDVYAIQRGAAKSENHRLADVLIETQRHIDAACQRKDLEGGSVRSGLFDVDKLTGGFHPGELAIIAARPSVGKTAFATQIAMVAAEDQMASVIFSLEQSRIELGSRLLCAQSGVDSHLVRTGMISRLETSRIIDACQQLSPLPIWINDTAAQKVAGIHNAVRRLASNVPLRLVVVDYLQLITADDRRGNRNEQVAEMSRSLKLLARELQVPVVCLCQLSRGVEQRGQGAEPRLSDLRDSGAIEQDADTVIFLHRNGERRQDDPSEFIDIVVAKQRNGPCGKVMARFIKQAMRFESLARTGM